MANFETLYPVDGSNALKAQPQGEERRAAIIDFPGAHAERIAPATQNPSGYEQLTSIFTRPLNERDIVKDLKCGSFEGSAFSHVTKLEGVIGGLIVTIAAFALFFL